MLNRNIFLILALFSIAMASCSDDDAADSAAHSALVGKIGEAQALLANTEEGLEEGNLAPGSKVQLTAQIEWAQYILDNSPDDAFENALGILQTAMDNYQGNTIKPGYPSFGVGSNMDIGTIADYDIRDKFTIEFDARFKDMTGGNLFTGEDASGGFITRYNAQGTLQAYVHNGGWVGGNVGFAFQPKVWYHLTFTFDGQNVVLYVDGVVRMTVGGAKNRMNVKPETHIKIGTHPTYEGRFFAGEVRQVSLWNVVKTPEQIAADTGRDFAADEQGLLAYWPLTLNLGTSILDKTGNHTMNGTLVTWIGIE
ncbi:hypothetical protein KK062_17715 [Fulvivirgaceae bacterium PWU5]|uniref:LamG-like jellyroll fold domain-containing protein n=1 Tax=Dawidia cretensis TaxID=2782350 RepID=A0AAP2E172_9BACT|nr:LamG domain-containing protein [Dawidia cretensis]MBT1710088.1 hypothetical protein [Dawidia cretensis]